MDDDRTSNDDIQDLEVPENDAEGVKGGLLPANEAILSPRDPASGLPTGKQAHKPFTIGDIG